MDTTFVDRQTPIVADWLNDVNDLRYGASDSARGSALLEYLRPGTVTVVRTSSSKMGDTLDARDTGATGSTADNGGTPIENALTITPLGRRLNLGIGQYRFDGGKTAAGPINLNGEGSGAGPGAVLNTHCSQMYANYLAGDVLYVGPSNYGSVVRDLQINSGVGQKTSGAGLKMVGTAPSVLANYRIENVALVSQYNGIELYQSWWGSIRNVFAYAWKNAAIGQSNNGVNEGAGGTWDNLVLFGDTAAGTTQLFGIDTTDGYTNVVNSLLLGSQNGARFSATTYPVGSIKVNGCSIEENDIAGVYFQNSGVETMTMVDVAGNEFSVATLGGAARTLFQGHVVLAAGAADWLSNVAVRHNMMRTTAVAAGGAFVLADTGSWVSIDTNILEGLGGNTARGIVVGAQADNLQVIDNIVRGTFGTKYQLTAECYFRDFGSRLLVAELPTCMNGSMAWVTDGLPGSNPLTTGGSGCVAVRQGGTWRGLPEVDSAPVTITAATYAVVPGVQSIIANRAGTITLTLPDATKYAGRELVVRTIQNQTVVSDASNVAALATGVTGTAILAGTAGKWAMLKSDGTNWQMMMAN